MKKLLIFLILGVFALTNGCATQAKKVATLDENWMDKSTDSVFLKADEVLEYKLACIDAGYWIQRDHISITWFRILLDQLSSSFSKDRQHIALATIMAREILKIYGIKESLFNIMGGIDQLYAIIKNQRYTRFLAAYMTLRSEGLNHAQAIYDLPSLLRDLKT